MTANGNTGHASRFIEGTAIEQIMGKNVHTLNNFLYSVHSFIHSLD